MTIPDSIAALKKSLRAHQVEVRRRAFLEAGEEAALAVAERVDLPAGTVVAAYWPMGDELDPRPLMRRLEEAGCPLALPVVTARGRALDFRAFSWEDGLEPGPHGTLHPPVASAALVPGVLLVPLLAFDRRCFRLGYGGGYYDRTLESLRRKGQVRTIGLGFAAQEVPAVPRDGHDQRLDAIATERELISPESA
jgi:5,10-methenyltetrahydrofolate synthetase